MNKQNTKTPITLQVGVKAFLKNSEGKYLLLHRNAEKYPEVQALWDIVGGRINPGTSLIENLRREIKEETGLKLIDEPQIIASQDILRIPGRHIVRLSYVGNISGEPVLDEENDEYRWLTISEMLALPEGQLDGYVKEILEKRIIT